MQVTFTAPDAVNDAAAPVEPVPEEPAKPAEEPAKPAEEPAKTVTSCSVFMAMTAQEVVYLRYRSQIDSIWALKERKNARRKERIHLWQQDTRGTIPLPIAQHRMFPSFSLANQPIRA